jgi:hypothetical protein
MRKNRVAPTGLRQRPAALTHGYRQARESVRRGADEVERAHRHEEPVPGPGPLRRVWEDVRHDGGRAAERERGGDPRGPHEGLFLEGAVRPGVPGPLAAADVVEVHRQQAVGVVLRDPVTQEKLVHFLAGRVTSEERNDPIVVGWLQPVRAEIAHGLAFGRGLEVARGDALAAEFAAGSGERAPARLGAVLRPS